MEGLGTRTTSPLPPQSSTDGAMGALTSWVLAHKRSVIGLWIVVVIAALVALGPAGNALSDEFSIPGREGFETNKVWLRSTGRVAMPRQSCPW